MSKYQEVEEQVKEAIANGSDIDSIKKSLLNRGYSEDDISEIILGAQTLVEVPAEPSIPFSPKVEESKSVINEAPQEGIINNSVEHQETITQSVAEVSSPTEEESSDRKIGIIKILEKVLPPLAIISLLFFLRSPLTAPGGGHLDTFFYFGSYSFVIPFFIYYLVTSVAFLSQKDTKRSLIVFSIANALLAVSFPTKVLYLLSTFGKIVPFLYFIRFGWLLSPLVGLIFVALFFVLYSKLFDLIQGRELIISTIFVISIVVTSLTIYEYNLDKNLLWHYKKYGEITESTKSLCHKFIYPPREKECLDYVDIRLNNPRYPLMGDFK